MMYYYINIIFFNLIFFHGKTTIINFTNSKFLKINKIKFQISYKQI